MANCGILRSDRSQELFQDPRSCKQKSLWQSWDEDPHQPNHEALARTATQGPELGKSIAEVQFSLISNQS